MWVDSLSSTMSRLAGVVCGGYAGSSGEMDDASIVKKKVVPLPGSLSAQIEPPISMQSRLQMANPSPVPPNYA